MSHSTMKNPYVNACAAALYIVVVACIMTFGQKSGPDPSVLVPIAVLSLFVLSAAVMGYLFLFQPAQMYLDGAKKEALDLFVRTVAVFAVLTIFFLVVLFFYAR